MRKPAGAKVACGRRDVHDPKRRAPPPTNRPRPATRLVVFVRMDANLNRSESESLLFQARVGAARLNSPFRDPTGRAVLSDEPWRATAHGIVIVCRLTPKGGRDAIEGVARLSDGAAVLVVRVRAAPENGRANEALRALLAEALDSPASSVRLTGGAKSRLKQVAVGGDAQALIARLRAL